MAFAWNPWALPGLLAALATLVAAVIVYTTASRRPINRLGSLVLFLSAAQIVWSFVAFTVFTDARSAYGAWALLSILDAATIPPYLAFVGAAVASPLSRPFRERRVLAFVSAPVVTFIALILAAPSLVTPSVTLVDHWYFQSLPNHAWPAQVAILGQGCTLLFAFVAALDSWRRSRRTATKGRAGAYALAFGVRDIGWGSAYVFGFATSAFALRGAIVMDALAFAFLFATACLTVFPMLLAYGILKHQLLDIDLKIKVAVRKSTVIAAFAVAFLVVSEFVERALGVEGEVFGVAAAVAVGLVFRRVEGVAGRLADRLMPGVEDTDEYRRVRKRDVYRAAIESALQDGEITERERSVLETLAEQMGLSNVGLQSIERDVEAALQTER